MKFGFFSFFLVSVVLGNLSAAIVERDTREGLCVAAATKRVPAALKEAFSSHIFSKSNMNCRSIRSPIDNPFSKELRLIAQKLEPQPYFLFWVDLESEESQILARVLDADSGLQLAVVRADRNPQTRETAQEKLEQMVSLLEKSVSTLVKSIPFDGIVSSDGFVFWAEATQKDLALFKAEPLSPDQKHPYLPSILRLKAEPLEGVTGRFVVDSGAGTKLELNKKPPDVEVLINFRDF